MGEGAIRGGGGARVDTSGAGTGTVIKGDVQTGGSQRGILFDNIAKVYLISLHFLIKTAWAGESAAKVW